jgi:alcohol dehydrogenase
MRQLTCTGAGVIGWRDVAEPELQGAGEALIRPIAVARCEIDPLLVLVGPTDPEAGFALGHEAVAEVVAVGPDVTTVQPGRRVLCSFQVSCGRCRSCRAGHSGNCDEQPVLSDYGMQPLSGIEHGGMVSDLVRVPYADAMLVPLPPGCDPVQLASVPDNVLDGYRAVAPHLQEQPGADVLVVCHGNRSIALYAGLAAQALGAGSVTFDSNDTEAIALADDLGLTARRTAFERRDGRWPIVVDCGVDAKALGYALASTEPEGVLHSVSYYAAEPTVGLPLGKLYTLGIRFFIGRAHSAALLPEVVDLVATGRLDPAPVTTEVVAWDDAAERYLDPTVKLVVTR